MYVAHPSQELSRLFKERPYQGVRPLDASFLFVGLDANYADQIALQPIFTKIRDYHADGVAFWRTHGVHHPFLLPEYSGGGRFYHRSFSRIGFTPAHADAVSFVELLDVPTVGRNRLAVTDLSASHLNWLNEMIMGGQAHHIFLPAAVARLMRASGQFPWLPRETVGHQDGLRVIYSDASRKIYSHLHFSTYGKFAQQKQAEAEAIRLLIPPRLRVSPDLPNVSADAT